MKINTLAEKKAYFEQVKLANFRESSRLEGLIFSTANPLYLAYRKLSNKLNRRLLIAIN